MNRYTLKQNHTGQYHLFEAHFNNYGQCVPESKSICKKMEDTSNSEFEEFKCEDEATTFLKCAELQKEVCGNCMQELYGDDE